MLQRGTKVTVAGEGVKPFTGTVLAASQDTLVILLAPGMSTTLFRDCASTQPLRWQMAGMPVTVEESRTAGFAALRDLEAFRVMLARVEKATR
jgi:hypothetical protein